MQSMRKSTSICGTKPITEPTPLMMPSTINPESHGAVPMPSKKEAAAGTIHSPTNTSFVQPVSQSPTVEMEM